MGRLIKIFLLLAAAVALLALFCISSCASLPFHPSRELTATPSAINLPYENVLLATSDNQTLAGWFIPAKDNHAGLTLLFFHGNAGNISHRLDSIAIFHGLGLSVFIIDYRGFGGSTGSPSVKGTLLDAQAAWNWLLTHKGLSPGQIIIFGRSLGGGVAAALAAQVRPRGLILESTFTSLYAVAKDLYPWLPVGLFLPEDYDTQGALENLRVPLLVVHSPDDEVVSYSQGRSLYDNYQGSKQLLELRGPHNSGFMASGNYVPGLQLFLRSLAPRASGG